MQHDGTVRSPAVVHICDKRWSLTGRLAAQVARNELNYAMKQRVRMCENGCELTMLLTRQCRIADVQLLQKAVLPTQQSKVNEAGSKEISKAAAVTGMHDSCSSISAAALDLVNKQKADSLDGGMRSSELLLAPSTEKITASMQKATEASLQQQQAALGSTSVLNAAATVMLSLFPFLVLLMAISCYYTYCSLRA